MAFTLRPWNAAYETHIEEIDLQHKYFLHLINRLGEELITTQDEIYRKRLIQELYRYASFHFVSEENLMFKVAYPDLEAHKILHMDLLNQLSFRGGDTSMPDLMDFLVTWFSTHTIKEDLLIGEFILQGQPGQR